MKKMIGIICAASLILTGAAFPADSTAYAASHPDYPGLEYEVYGNSVTITRTWADLPDEAVIPAEIDGKPVTCIAAGAFDSCRTMRSISIPESVSFIGARICILRKPYADRAAAGAYLYQQQRL